MSTKRRSGDLRYYARQTNIQLLIGAFLLLLIVGMGLIYLIYGAEAALLGLICVLGALVPVVLIVGILFGMQRWVTWQDNKSNEQ